MPADEEVAAVANLKRGTDGGCDDDELAANAALDRDLSLTNLDRRSPRAVNGVPGAKASAPTPDEAVGDNLDVLYPLAV